jgi:hypothetical protein
METRTIAVNAAEYAIASTKPRDSSAAFNSLRTSTPKRMHEADNSTPRLCTVMTRFAKTSSFPGNLTSPETHPLNAAQPQIKIPHPTKSRLKEPRETKLLQIRHTTAREVNTEKTKLQAVKRRGLSYVPERFAAHNSRMA